MDYDWKGGMPGKVGRPGEPEHQLFERHPCATKSFSATGMELGGKVALGDFEAVAYAFRARAWACPTVGAQFFGGSNRAGNKTDSQGYFLQGTYKMGATKFGINYGANKDKDGFALTGAGTSNRSPTGRSPWASIIR